MSNNTTKSKKSLILKIVIPVVIVCVVAGIWVVKNSQKPTGSEEITNPDFVLNATQTFDVKQLKSYGLPILIEFGADYCDPCKQMAPIIEALNEELQGKAIIKFVDVENYPDIAANYPISVIPTQVFIDSTGKPYQPSNPDTLGIKLYSDNNTGESTFTTHEGTLTKDQLVTILKEMGMK